MSSGVQVRCNKETVKGTSWFMKKSNSEVTNILLAGVGGQGILLASTVISMAAMESGYDVKNNEVHGMAQRGGSVVSQIRFGKKVHSPLIKKGSADFLIALEKLEALRYAEYLKDDGVALVNDFKISPLTVSSGQAQYPPNTNKLLMKTFSRLQIVEGVKMAQDLGNARTSNVILIGLLSNYLPFKIEIWKNVIKKSVKERFVDINLKAFELGRQLKK